MWKVVQENYGSVLGW